MLRQAHPVGMTPRLAPVLSPADLPVAELCGARLDGEVYATGDGWCPVDEIDDAGVRSRAAALLVPPRAVAERMTAAWIYGACAEPARQQYCIDAASRVKMMLSPRIRLREVALHADDVVTLPGMRVTSPIRTMADIARDETAGDDDAVGALTALMERFDASGAIVLGRLPRSGRQRACAEARLRTATALLAARSGNVLSRR